MKKANLITNALKTIALIITLLGLATKQVSAQGCPATSYSSGWSITALPAPTMGSMTYGPLPPSTVYYLAANTTIPPGATVTFENAIVMVANNVKITIAAGATLNLEGSHFMSADCSMWQGFVIATSTGASGTTGTLNMIPIGTQANLIEDAKDAVSLIGATSLTTGYWLSINNAIFNKCTKAIDIENYPSTSTSFPWQIFSTVFTSRSFTPGPTGAYPFTWASEQFLTNYFPFPPPSVVIYAPI